MIGDIWEEVELKLKVEIIDEKEDGRVVIRYIAGYFLDQVNECSNPEQWVDTGWKLVSKGITNHKFQELFI
jgi:hypothetical protein